METIDSVLVYHSTNDIDNPFSIEIGNIEQVEDRIRSLLNLPLKLGRLRHRVNDKDGAYALRLEKNKSYNFSGYPSTISAGN